MLSKHSQSLLDMLLRVMPELRLRLPSGSAKTNNKAAKALYTIWSNEAHKVADKAFRRPTDVASGDMKLLEDEGLITASGDNLTITKKGGEVLKEMILGDDRSIFDESKAEPDYFTALANTKSTRRSRTKTASTDMPSTAGRNWYMDLKDGIDSN